MKVADDYVIGGEYFEQETQTANIFLNESPQNLGNSHLSPGVTAQTMSHCNHEDVAEILKELKFMSNRLRREDELSQIVAEWRFAAMVVDRLCLVLFSTFTIVSTLVCVTSVPHLLV